MLRVQAHALGQEGHWYEVVILLHAQPATETPDVVLQELLAVAQGSALQAAIEAGDLAEQHHHDQHRALALELEQAHYHLSYLPAWTAGFKDRGALKEGLAADILVYDLAKLAIKPMEVLYDVPPNNWRRVQGAEGYRWIMVNGQVTFEDGKATGSLPGKLLRYS